uniref:Transcription termination factor 2 isoform X1 n=1 Tax=Pogona vitticeps TaxID=103695 RepID=A0A6J0T128_9SAUR
MEKVLCSGHEHLCVLKTGVRHGPNKGKSFYICGVQDQESCGFVLATELSPSHCLVHEKDVVDLQVLMKLQETDTYSLLYRCSKAKLEGKKWCGSVPWQDSKATTLPVKPQFQHMLEEAHDHRGRRNPFKIPNKNNESSAFKQTNDNGNNNPINKEKKKKQTPGSNEKDWKLSSETIRKDLPATVNTKNKQLGKKCESLHREGKETQTKSTEKENALCFDECKFNADKMCETSLGYTGQDLTLRSKESGLQTEERSKQTLPSSHSQASSVKHIDNEQLRKGSSESWRDKSEMLKTTGRWGNEGKARTPGDPVTVQKPTGLLEAHPKGNQEKSPTLVQERLALKENNCSNKNISKDEQDIPVPFKTLSCQGLEFHQEKGCSGKNRSSILPEMNVLHMRGEVDLKVLHNQLSAELRQKKKTLKLVHVQALPDKGERLIKQVEELESALRSLNLETEESLKEGSLSHTECAEVQHNPFNRTTAEQSAAVMGKKLQPCQEDSAASSLELHPPLALNQYGSKKSAGRMTEDPLQAVYNATSDAINQLHKSLETCPTMETVSEDPPGLKVSLLLHQKQALAWLLWRENQKPCGGILADDMGLGKTLSMIALILAQKSVQRKEGKENKLEMWLSKQDFSVIISHGTLIVCPASLVHHWKKEVERHVKSGKLKVCLYHGSNRIKNTTVLAEYDVVVTTYSILAKEIPTHKEEAETAAEDLHVEDKSLPFSPLPWIHWARIILDEAHNIKNPKVQTSIAACKLKATARWAVTGTPIQNNLLDMYSLLRFLRCSPFDEFRVWKNQVDNNTRKGGERLAILTRSLLLRRTKDQLDSLGKPLVPLPQRLTRLHRLKLAEDEQSVYDVLFARSRSTLQSYLRRQEARYTGTAWDNPFDKGVGQQEALGKPGRDAPPISTTIHILSLLLRLRQCCCHLSLLKVALDKANLNSEGISLSLEEQLNALTLSESESGDPHSMVYLLGAAFTAELFETTKQSTKLSHLLKELKAIQGHSQKSVVVSQWTSMLKVVAAHLEKLGLRYATVDGSVNPKQRMDAVEEFNNNSKGPKVMLISLLAGGVGLNLIGGNHLFLLDMHWNPALEDQACDRIYRVGQRNDVTIHRFVCEGTVEEKISELQAKKKELAQKVLSGKSDCLTKLTLADLKLLFGF